MKNLFLLIIVINCLGCAPKKAGKSTDQENDTSSLSADSTLCISSPLKDTFMLTDKSANLKVELNSIQLDSNRRVILSVQQYNSADYPALSTSADSAMHIASVLLSSREFQDSVKKYTFTCKNYKSYCATQCLKCNDRINGAVVIDSVFRSKHVPIKLFLDKKDNGSFGSAARNVFRITSHYPVIRRDDKTLPFSYSYGYHIAHEYMHILGFYHTDHKDDVAERIGIVGYYIIRRWHKNLINPMQTNL